MSVAEADSGGEEAGRRALLNLNVKKAAFRLEKASPLAKQVNLSRRTFGRYVDRFVSEWGADLGEALFKMGVRVESSTEESWESLQKKRIAALLSDPVYRVVDSKGKGRPAYLSEADESRVAQIAKFCGHRQVPLDVACVASLVQDVLRARNVRSSDKRLVTSPSRHLIRNIFRRNDLTLRRAEKLEVTSSGGLSKETVHQYALALGAALDAFAPHSFQGDNVWNLDETGCSLESLGRQMLTFSMDERHAIVAMNATNDRVSGMFAVSASGIVGPVSFVFPRVLFPRTFIEEAAALCPKWLLYGNDTGWFKLAEFRRYMKQFIAFLNSIRPPDRTDILIMDNLSVHLNKGILELMERNRLTPVFLPPRSTSYLQPLDVYIFGPLKNAYHHKRGAELTAKVLEQIRNVPSEMLDKVQLTVPLAELWDIPRFLKNGIVGFWATLSASCAHFESAEYLLSLRG
jgi:hypothetical protein